jgi:phytoene dehydrogenase-like protein
MGWVERPLPPDVDVLVIGAGVAGLLVAAYALGQGRSVLVLERRRIPGGRFSGETVAGAQLSTGALHLIPHGSRGPLARALRELGIEQPIVDSDVICSVWTPRHHVVCTRPHHLFTRVLRPRQWGTAVRFFLHLYLDRDRGDTLTEWLRHRRIRGELAALLRSCVDFALSVHPDQLAWRDFRAIYRSFWRMGGPGLPLGGSRGLAERLLQHVCRGGGQVLLHTEATELERRERGWVVSYRGRGDGARGRVVARQVVATALEVLPTALPEPDPACGFKLQLLLPFSLVPHRGVMFCTGTRRLSGLVQPSNADPSLAPPGWHLINTFHACAADADPQVERREALADLAQIAGRPMDTGWVLQAALYRSSWPVNRRRQGRELPERLDGCYLAGDACKPPGLIMVEAAAESARRTAALLQEAQEPRPTAKLAV